MRKVIYAGKGKVGVAEGPEPQPGYGQVKIKLHYCAICATDLHIVTMGLFNYPYGVTLGHESTGEVVALGPGTEDSGFQIGDRVIPNPLGTCGICENCRRNLPSFCEQKMKYLCKSMAEYCVADVKQVFKIPAGGDLRHYALAEPMTCAMRAMDLAGIRHGQTVAISGVGGIGSLLLNMILLAGGTRVTAIDPVAAKRQNALAMGAQYVIDPASQDVEKQAMEITNGRGFDFVFEASGVPSATEPCLDMLANAGTIVFFAVYPTDFAYPLNLYKLYSKEARIQAAWTDVHLYPRVIDLIPRMQMDKIIGTVVPLTQAESAFELFKQSVHPKILIDCRL